MAVYSRVPQLCTGHIANSLYHLLFIDSDCAYPWDSNFTFSFANNLTVIPSDVDGLLLTRGGTGNRNSQFMFGHPSANQDDNRARPLFLLFVLNPHWLSPVPLCMSMYISVCLVSGVLVLSAHSDFKGVFYDYCFCCTTSAIQ